jgi:hypothetical protein
MCDSKIALMRIRKLGAERQKKYQKRLREERLTNKNISYQNNGELIDDILDTQDKTEEQLSLIMEYLGIDRTSKV